MFDWSGFWTAAIGGLTGGITIIGFLFAESWYRQWRERRYWQQEKKETEGGVIGANS
ncbi:hypothetical protein [Sporomusa paucivorans]|uniref:hypothetical protein n=1 Tax=Sporomusa paucivorans TaxID=2376 RepID=UPI003570DC0F